jgi:hypothetical protein
MTCPKCKAAVLPNDPRIDSFHEDCYTNWLASLYDELNGKKAVVSKAAA